jgi:hypothetical protein
MSTQSRGKRDMMDVVDVIHTHEFLTGFPLAKSLFQYHQTNSKLVGWIYHWRERGVVGKDGV